MTAAELRAEATGGAAAARTAAIRRLNDELRQLGRGGRAVVTARVAALAATDLAAIVRAVTTFEAFGPDNDPHGEHDCAVMTVGEHRIIWKIDAYDRALRFGSPDPADPAVTARVLTIMLAEEY